MNELGIVHFMGEAYLSPYYIGVYLAPFMLNIYLGHIGSVRFAEKINRNIVLTDLL